MKIVVLSNRRQLYIFPFYFPFTFPFRVLFTFPARLDAIRRDSARIGAIRFDEPATIAEPCNSKGLFAVSDILRSAATSVVNISGSLRFFLFVFYPITYQIMPLLRVL
jgi:hypothetical protein